MNGEPTDLGSGLPLYYRVFFVDKNCVDQSEKGNPVLLLVGSFVWRTIGKMSPKIWSEKHTADFSFVTQKVIFVFVSLCFCAWARGCLLTSSSRGTRERDSVHSHTHAQTHTQAFYPPSSSRGLKLTRTFLKVALKILFVFFMGYPVPSFF